MGTVSLTHAGIMVGGSEKPVLKLKDMEEKHLHNLFLKNMSGLIEEVKNPTPRLNPNSKCGGMATHAGLAIELGITRKKSLSPQMEAILIWRYGHSRRPGHRAGHHQEEESLSPDGGYPDLV